MSTSYVTLYCCYNYIIPSYAFLLFGLFVPITFIFPFSTVTLDHPYCSPHRPASSHQSSSAMSNSVLSTGLAHAQCLIEQSVRRSTALKYKTAFQRWSDYSCRANIPEFPASSDHVASCLATLASETHSVSIVEAVYAAISHAHRCQNLPSPTSSLAISLLMRSIRTQFQKLRSPAAPLDAAMIRRFFAHLYHPQHGENGLRYISSYTSPILI